MPTTFVMRDLAIAASASEQIGAHPTYGYANWTHDLLVSRRAGTSPTLDVVIQEAPQAEESLFEAAKTFVQVNDATSLPHSASDATAFAADTRYMRIDQTVSGAGAEWTYQVKATVTLFDPADPDHLPLIEPRFQSYDGLDRVCAQSETEVVRRYTERRPGAFPASKMWLNQPLTGIWLLPQYGKFYAGILMLEYDEFTGDALRRAIAARANWKLRLRELEQSGKAADGPLSRMHLRAQWQHVDEQLHEHDMRTPAVMV